MAIFDQFEEMVMDATAYLFGDVCTWSPLEGGPTQEALVCFKEPTKKQGPAGFIDDMPTVEYKRGIFPGLAESSRKGKNKERIILKKPGRPDKIYGIRAPRGKYDGDTIILELNPDVSQDAV